MKKKFLALALSALMVTGLVGCGSSDNSGNSGEGTLKVGMYSYEYEAIPSGNVLTFNIKKKWETKSTLVLSSFLQVS